MGAQIRVYRQKIASTSSMKKIFKAMEMIATSRINKARNAAQAAGPYANALTRVVTAVATQQGIKHPLISRTSSEPTNTAAPQSWLLPVTAVWQVRTPPLSCVVPNL